MSDQSRETVVSVEHLVVRYGNGPIVLDDVNLSLRSGEAACIVGPSGCGKTTLVHTIAGFIRPTSGRVIVNGSVVSGPGPDRGVVQQSLALFPFLNVRGNVEFGLRMRGMPRPARRFRSDQVLSSVGLSAWANAYPDQLSGGMQQRAAIARTIINSPTLLLMDEPFNAADAETRSGLQGFLSELVRSTAQTLLFVTHDIDEAMCLGDRLVVLSSRPSRVMREFPLAFPYPRSLVTMLESTFIDTKREVLRLIRDEVRL